MIVHEGDGARYADCDIVVHYYSRIRNLIFIDKSSYD
jgi:hypothetical protein